MKLAPLIRAGLSCGCPFYCLWGQLPLPKNIMNILNQMALPLVVALGLTFVIMLGSIDLSIDGSVGMAGSPVCLLCPQANSEFAYDLGFLSVVIAVGVSMLCGLLIGLCHVYLKIPSFMASLCLFMHICKGIGMVSPTYQGILSHRSRPRYYGSATTTFLGIPLSPGLPLGYVPCCAFYSGVYRLRPAYLRRGHQ